MKKIFFISLFCSLLIFNFCKEDENLEFDINQLPKNTVYLTFDDGPDPIYTPQILDILDAFQIKATFFMVGNHVRKYPDIALDVYLRGHTVGNHTQTHKRWCEKMSLDSFLKYEFNPCQEELKNALGVYPKIYRPAWGSYNLEQYNYLKNQGVKTILWNLDPADYDTIKNSVSRMRITILEHVKINHVVLLHDGLRKRDSTLKLLPQIIDTLQKLKYNFFPIPY